MELKTGYRQTDIGFLPADWPVEPLERFLTQKATYGVVKAGKFQAVGIPMLRGGDIVAGRIGSDHPLISFEKSSEYARTVLRENDVVIALVGYPGEAAVVPARLTGANISRAVGLLRTTDMLNPSFLVSLLNSPSGRAEFLRPSAGSAQIVVNLASLNKMRLPVPSLPEQRAIAEALADVDAAIEALSKLVAKKRDLRTAVMQQLLTGGFRLSDFDEPWIETSIAAMVRHHSGNSGLIKGKLAQISISGFFPGYSASGQDVWLDRFEYEGDAIIVSAVGSRCGKSFLATGKWSAIANTHVIWPDPKKVDLRFLMLFLNDEDYWEKGGSGQPFILFKKTFAKTIHLPPVEEQAAIADVLQDIDDEISSISARLAKTRALKQAMMQALLTGRVRLPVPDVDEAAKEPARA